MPIELEQQAVNDLDLELEADQFLDLPEKEEMNDVVVSVSLEGLWKKKHLGLDELKGGKGDEWEDVPVGQCQDGQRLLRMKPQHCIHSRQQCKSLPGYVHREELLCIVLWYSDHLFLPGGQSYFQIFRRGLHKKTSIVMVVPH